MLQDSKDGEKKEDQPETLYLKNNITLSFLGLLLLQNPTLNVRDASNMTTPMGADKNFFNKTFSAKPPLFSQGTTTKKKGTA